MEGRTSLLFRNGSSAASAAGSACSFRTGALLGSLTLAENVGLPLSEHTKLSGQIIRSTVLRTLALVGLEEFADYYPNELSGGMKKRGGLARAIVTEPPVLFCDEPTSGLDPINSAQMDQLLLDMRRAYPDMTIIVVSHDLASVARVADHVLVLREGRVVFAGSHEELKASPTPICAGSWTEKPPARLASPQRQQTPPFAGRSTPGSKAKQNKEG